MDDYLAAIDAELREIAQSHDSRYDAYYGMFRYHLGWSDENFSEIKADAGKRIRPLLCLLSYEAVGGNWRDALPIAAAIELVHNFSLIHDDIEDKSEERRGRTTVWKVWGLAQGLNAGDGMFVLARLALGRMNRDRFNLQKCATISAEFDNATLALCQGQYLDLSFEKRVDVTAEEYLQMIQGKTAALISAATSMGTILGTEDAATIRAFSDYGRSIGMAFQITDDILGIWGDSSLTGKSTATDILSRKKSLPAIIGMNDARHGNQLREIYSQPSLARDDVNRVLALLDDIGAQKQAQRLANEYRETAITSLEQINFNNRATERLLELADVMTNRVR